MSLATHYEWTATTSTSSHPRIHTTKWLHQTDAPLSVSGVTPQHEVCGRSLPGLNHKPFCARSACSPCNSMASASVFERDKVLCAKWLWACGNTREVLYKCQCTYTNENADQSKYIKTLHAQLSAVLFVSYNNFAIPVRDYSSLHHSGLLTQPDAQLCLVAYMRWEFYLFFYVVRVVCTAFLTAAQ